MDILGTLSEIQYLKWRISIYELNANKLQLQLVEKENAIMEKDIEISKLKIGLYRAKIQTTRSLYEEALNAYQLHKQTLEEQVGFSLTDTVIDEVTHEIKKL